MEESEIIEILKSMENNHNKAGMARFGINVEKALGISMKELHPIAKSIGKNHQLALNLWETDIHEARILAILIDKPQEVSSEQMDKWVLGFNSWDLCDQATMKLFCKSPLAWVKVEQWYNRDEEYVKRASFALMASLALHEKSRDNEPFIKLLEMIAEKPDDERNFVSKAINWALRQIGKRNLVLREAAIATANVIFDKFKHSKSARRVANGALREFEKDSTLARTIRSRHN